VYQCFTATCGVACGALLEAGPPGDGGEAGAAEGGITDGGGVVGDGGDAGTDTGG